MAQRGLEVVMVVCESKDSTRRILRLSDVQLKQNRWCYEVTRGVAPQRFAAIRPAPSGNLAMP
jgi:hypothetical protein